MLIICRFVCFLVIYYFDCCKFGISNLNVVFYMNFNFGHLCLLILIV